MANINIPIQDNLQYGPTDLGSYVSQIVGVFLSIAAIAAFVYLVLAGIQWITAGGDKNKLEEAKNRITGAIIGLVIVAASWAIFVLIDSFLGLNIAGQTSSSYNNGGGGGGTPSGSVNSLCHCNDSSLCASTGDISPGTDNQNYICDANSGWITTSQTWSGNAITCSPCN